MENDGVNEKVVIGSLPEEAADADEAKDLDSPERDEDIDMQEMDEDVDTSIGGDLDIAHDEGNLEISEIDNSAREMMQEMMRQQDED